MKSLRPAHFFLFICSLALSATTLRAFAPYPAGSESSFREFASTKDDYDVLFVGSSHLARGIVPELFDERLRARGIRIRTYNLNMKGGGGHEIDRMVRWALHMKPKKLRLLIVEPRPWVSPRRTYITHRTVWWHTPLETSLAVRGAWKTEDDRGELRKIISYEIRHGLIHFFGIGTLTLPRDPDLEDEINRGWDPFSVSARSTMGPENYASYLQRISALPRKADIGSYNVAAQISQRALLSRGNFRFAYILPPTARYWKSMDAAEQLGLFDPVVDMSDPEQFPRLFELDSRHGRSHLSNAGALLFTEELAKVLYPYLAEKHSNETS